MPSTVPESYAVPPARTVLAVDDHDLVRIGLRSVIEQRFAQRLAVAEAQTLEAALAFLQQREPEVLAVVLDLNLADTRGLTGLHLIRRLHPLLPVIVVSGLIDPRVRQEALMHGAVAFVGKDAAGGATELLSALERLIGDAPPVSRAANEGSRFANPQGWKLGRRQLQVLELVLGGKDNLAIAHETGLALGSVKNIVSALYLAFDVKSRAELIRLFAS